MPMKDTNFLMGKVIHKRYKVGERIAAGEYSPLLWQRILLLTTLPFQVLSVPSTTVPI